MPQSSSTRIEEPGGRKTMQHAAKSSKQHVQASLIEIHNLGSGLLLPCSQAVLRYFASLWICAALHLGCPFSRWTRVSCCRVADCGATFIDCPYVVSTISRIMVKKRNHHMRMDCWHRWLDFKYGEGNGPPPLFPRKRKINVGERAL